MKKKRGKGERFIKSMRTNMVDMLDRREHQKLKSYSFDFYSILKHVEKKNRLKVKYIICIWWHRD